MFRENLHEMSTNNPHLIYWQDEGVESVMTYAITNSLFYISSHFPAAVNKSTDYANYFQGLWDCSGDHPDELSFRRGDNIYILSKVRQKSMEGPGKFQARRSCHNPHDYGPRNNAWGNVYHHACVALSNVRGKTQIWKNTSSHML